MNATCNCAFAPPPTRPGEPPERWREFVRTFKPQVQSTLAASILPFWWRAIDERHGGVFSCWNNAGTRLVSRDKFTWSQGRFAWLWARLGEATARGLLSGQAAAYVAHARKTARFLEEHALLRDGRCAFLLSEDGAVIEAFAGAGPAPSIYADCFVAMGFAEVARVTGDGELLRTALELAGAIGRSIDSSVVPTHPDPIPPGHESYALAMIGLNVAVVVEEACVEFEHAQAGHARDATRRAAARVFERFVRPDGRVAELVPHDGTRSTLLARHINPGHALEGAWLLLTVADRLRHAEWIARATDIVRFALERGWDEAQGGLLHYADYEGGEPRGGAGASPYEQSVRATWDAKLWWVHSEALYAAALAYRLTGDEALREGFARVWEYALRVFPQPDPAIGEWIQIRDRRGEPLERVVALPVKDPYHIARNLLLLLELFSESAAPPPA